MHSTPPTVMPMTERPRPIHRVTLPALVAVALGAVTVAPQAAAIPDSNAMTLTYELSGAGTAGYVTYQTNTGQQHAVNAALPWTMQLTGWMTSSSNPAPYSLSAQSAGPGSLTCTIRINGAVVSRQTATGNPARVLCEHHGKR